MIVTSETTFYADINDSRLQFAKKLGADSTVNVSGLSPREAADKILSLMPAPPSALLECSGADSSYQMGLLVSALLQKDIHTLRVRGLILSRHSQSLLVYSLAELSANAAIPEYLNYLESQLSL